MNNKKREWDRTGERRKAKSELFRIFELKHGVIGGLVFTTFWFVLTDLSFADKVQLFFRLTSNFCSKVYDAKY